MKPDTQKEIEKLVEELNTPETNLNNVALFRIRFALTHAESLGFQRGQREAWERLDALPKFIANGRKYTLRIKPIPAGKLPSQPPRWMVRYLAGDMTWGATEAPTLQEAVEMMHARLTPPNQEGKEEV